MKKKIFILFLLCLLPFAILFSGCNPVVIDLELNGNMEILIGTFKIEDYAITIFKDDDTTTEVALSEKYISSEDLAKLNTIGEHTITINYSNYSEEFTIIVKKHTFANLEFNDATFTYDGNAKTIEVENVPSGANVSYNISNEQTQAGTYEITATVTQQNYEDVTLTATLTIEKAEYNLSLVSFANKSVTYNGEKHSIEVAGTLPQGVTVKYFYDTVECDGKINADYYNVVAKFYGDFDNYNTIPDKTATLTIIPKQIDMSGVSLSDKTVTYNGSKHSLEIDGQLPNLVNVRYFYNNSIADGKINAGDYVVKASFSTTDSNYKVISYLTANLRIEKATYNMSGVAFEQKEFTYDGKEKSLKLVGEIPSGVTVKYYYNGTSSTGVTNAGSHSVVARFTGDANYNTIDAIRTTMVIQKATVDENIVLFNNKTVTYNGSRQYITINGTLPSEVTVTYRYESTNAYFYGETYPGEYEIVAKFDTGVNYNKIPSKTATLTIEKINYDMSAVVFEDKTFEYDGTAKSLEISGKLPTGVNVEYYYNNNIFTGLVEQGEYEIVAKFTGDTRIYNDIPSLNATLTITRQEHTITFKQEGQPDVIRTVLNLADLTDIPSPNNEGVEKGYGYVWSVTDFSCITSSFEVTSSIQLLTYKITYDYGPASVPDGSPTTYNVFSDTIVITAPTYNSHKLLGLYANDDYSNPITTIPSGSTGDIKISAWWDILTEGVKIYFDSSEQYYYVSGYSGTAKAVYLPDYYQGYPVGEIFDRTFKDKNICAIRLPETLQWIGESAFENCTSLSTIHIPSSITTLEQYSFRNCTSLQKVTFGENIQSLYGSMIPKEMFAGCSSLKSITIPKCVAYIYDGAFKDCTSLESINFEEGTLLTSIYNYNFNNCKIKELTLPDRVSYIGLNCFENCTLLEKINISENSSLKSILDYAFANCTSLTSIVLTKNVERLFALAFDGCTNLKTIYNLTKITLTAGGTNYSIEKYATNIYLTLNN